MRTTFETKCTCAPDIGGTSAHSMDSTKQVWILLLQSHPSTRMRTFVCHRSPRDIPCLTRDVRPAEGPALVEDATYPER